MAKDQPKNPILQYRLICTGNGHNKFYEVYSDVQYDKYQIWAHYGKIGYAGKWKLLILYSNTSLFTKALEKIKAQKIKKGYIDAPVSIQAVSNPLIKNEVKKLANKLSNTYVPKIVKKAKEKSKPQLPNRFNTIEFD